MKYKIWNGTDTLITPILPSRVSLDCTGGPFSTVGLTGAFLGGGL